MENKELKKMKKIRRQFIELVPALVVIILFSFVQGKEILVNLFFPQLGTVFMPAFFCSYILIMKYREGVIKKWALALLYAILFSIAAAIPQAYGYSDISYRIANVLFILLAVLLAYVVYLAFDWLRVAKKVTQLQEQNLKSELAVLKNQINPHFLFNTLNNIDSLIKTDADKASASLIELSDMMRYMLYETNTEKVFLKDEINYIESYLHLQSLQYANQELVEYVLEGDVGLKRIAPMLFIPFIENAFKHCTDKNVKHAIRFSFIITDKTIKFEAVNINSKTKEITKDRSSGAGLDIVKRRLNLLYPNKYALDISDRNNLFSVKLIIDYYAN